MVQERSQGERRRTKVGSSYQCGSICQHQHRCQYSNYVPTIFLTCPSIKAIAGWYALLRRHRAKNIRSDAVAMLLVFSLVRSVVNECRKGVSWSYIHPFIRPTYVPEIIHCCSLQHHRNCGSSTQHQNQLLEVPSACGGSTRLQTRTSAGC